MKPVTLRPFSTLTGDDLATATERAKRMEDLSRVLNSNSDLKKDAT